MTDTRIHGRFERRLSRLWMTVVGAGRAGSFAALVAGMAGVRHIRIYDDDRLDPDRNIAVQFYSASDIHARRPKAEALPRLLSELIPSIQIVSCPERFEARRRQLVDPVVVLAVDTMAARLSLAEKLLRRREVGLLLDVRLGGSVMTCYSVAGGSSVDWYRSTCYSDSEAQGETCGDSPEPHIAAGAAAFVAGAVMAYLRNRAFPRMITVDFDSASFLLERSDT